jgi:Pin2-interacting protein X1
MSQPWLTAAIPRPCRESVPPTEVDGSSLSLKMANVSGINRLYQGVERDGFGMRMLASMGWQEGKGIGKNGTGIAKHIHAKKRALNSGIGADARADASGKIDWTLNAVSFDNILKGLNQTYAADQVVVDEGQPTEQTPQEVTEKNVSGDLHKNLKIKESGRSTVGHAGRYRKRESHKRVKNYSAVDLDAILGGISGFSAVPAPLTAEVPVGAQEPGAGVMREETVKAEKSNRRSGKEKREKRTGSSTKSSQAPQPGEGTKPKQTLLPPPPKDWWGWTIGFVPAGHVGDAEIEDASDIKRKRGFDENDQERLAMAAHDSANRGKRGLGVGSHVVHNLRVADVDCWKGQRVRFDEPCEEVSTVTKERAPKKAKRQKKEKKNKS